MTKIKKILIANRGEIAVRFARSAHKMGKTVVAVYSDADKDSPHVRAADEAVHIGAASAAQSYLDADKIIAAAKEKGADAIFPGYGFLSEKADFAERVAKEGLTWIGPKASAIRAMGDKITSKKIAADAGVSVVPGYLGLIKDAKEAVKIAGDIGYPVMIKASAGGGGKGMRIARSAEEVAESFRASQAEAESSFGDDRIFIERYVEKPRHIEMQLLGDKHGNYFCFGERECSIQRRRQKVVEEAPSPHLHKDVRIAMWRQCRELAKAVDYDSVGTVEFIVDSDWNFYFLEMNTRLQVEHAVSELVTGVDIVDHMIEAAEGKELDIPYDFLKFKGHAIESRIYAEDPYRNFLPSIGRLTRYRPPQDGRMPSDAFVRNDSGVIEGSEISMFYDPMIAKLSTWAPTRERCINAMNEALNMFELEGIDHNIPFLSAIMQNERFKAGDTTTAFIEEEYPDGFDGVKPDPRGARRLAALSTVMHFIEARRDREITGRTRDEKIYVPHDWVTRIDGKKYDVNIKPFEGMYLVKIHDHSDGQDYTKEIVTRWNPGQTRVVATVNSDDFVAKVTNKTDGFRMRYNGCDERVFVRTPRRDELAQLMPEKEEPDTSKLLLCPMPGMVMDIRVKVGDTVQAGDVLCVLEAMKMENVLRAEKKLVVKEMKAEIGDNLPVNSVIMEFE